MWAEIALQSRHGRERERDFAISVPSVRALRAIGRFRPEYCQIGHAVAQAESRTRYRVLEKNLLPAEPAPAKAGASDEAMNFRGPALVNVVISASRVYMTVVAPMIWRAAPSGRHRCGGRRASRGIVPGHAERKT
jgi:hypothetical protein